jgi:hypothetical protein
MEPEDCFLNPFCRDDPLVLGKLSCVIASPCKRLESLYKKLLGNPAACRGHKTDGVSKGENR